ncbi:MAG: hypothetical protein ACOY4L_12185 [Pseudomonadota bacterium]
MTERTVAEQLTELGSAPVPGSELLAFQSEVLARASFGTGAAHITPEAATSPWPPGLAAHLTAESLAGPWPPIEVPALWVEVLRRDTASSAIVATGMNAFGDAPWPDAQRGVFAFRHDWMGPLVERLEWQTSVTRLASGNESRQARRRVPRRLLTYKVGNARQTDALVADWLADHLGQMALWPLPQYAARLAQDAGRGALGLFVSGEWVLHFMPTRPGLELDAGGLNFNWFDLEYWVIILAQDGWQTARLSAIQSDALRLAEPLARPAAAGSLVMNLVFGRATDPCDLTQCVPGVVNGHVSAEIAFARPPEIVIDDPLLDGIPVWPDGNWRDDPTASVQATITRQDLSPADPWVRRDDPWPTTTFQRRYLAGTPVEIDLWHARLWRTQGRLEAFWLPDGLAPILWVISDADPEDGFLRVTGDDVSAFWHRPAACLIIHPDGTRQYTLTAACHRDQGGVLVLRSGLDAVVPTGSRVVRLTRCRLDHDAIDLYWHGPTLVEIPLTAHQLPEPRCNDRSTYMPS